MATELRGIAHDRYGKNRGDRAYAELTNNPDKYGIIAQRNPATRQIIYGTLLGNGETTKK